jgi:hypothetical protein
MPPRSTQAREELYQLLQRSVVRRWIPGGVAHSGVVVTQQASKGSVWREMKMEPKLALLEMFVVACAVVVGLLPVYLRRRYPGHTPPLSPALLSSLGFLLFAASLHVMRRNWDAPRGLRPYALTDGLGVAALACLVGAAILMAVLSKSRYQNAGS